MQDQDNHEPEGPEAALFWLNDHCGGVVTLSLQVDVGSHGDELLATEGELRHWRDRSGIAPAGGEIERLRESLRGRYYLGDMELDLTTLPEASRVRTDLAPSDVARALLNLAEDGQVDGLEMEIADGVWLRFIAPRKQGSGGDA